MFKNIKIVTKLMWGFLILTFFTLIIGVTSFYYIKVLDKTVETIKHEAEEVIIVEKFRTDYIQKFQAVFDYVQKQNIKDLGIFYEKDEEIEKTFLNSSSYIRKFDQISGPRVAESLQNEFIKLNTIASEIIRLIENRRVEQAKEMETWQLRPSLEELNDLLNFIVKKEKLDLERAQTQAKHEKDQAGKLMALSVLFTFIVSVFLSIRVRSLIKRSLAGLQDAIAEVRSGNYDYKIKVKNEDEIGDVSHGFNKMATVIQRSRSRLDKQVMQIREARDKSETQRKQISKMLKEVKAQKNVSQKLADDLKKFELAVEGASDYIAIADDNMRIIHVNKAGEDITGYKRGEILGKPLLWAKKIGSVEYHKIWDTVVKQKEVFQGELQGEREDGEEYTVEVHITPLLDEKKQIKFLVEIDRDVTKAKAVDKMKTEFVTLASHQLRTPLSALKWLIEMLQDDDTGDLTEEQKDLVSQAMESNNRMIMLVNNLLNVARLDAGTMLMNPEIIDLQKLTESIMNEIKPMADEKTQEISFVCIECDKKAPKAFADENVFNQVMSNLITNAVKYTPNSGKITIKLRCQDEFVLCEVSDNGLGIPKIEQSRVFNQFFRANNVTKTDTQGSGLGLYAAKLMVEFSGGEIGFNSQENKETTFWFTLPKAS